MTCLHTSCQVFNIYELREKANMNIKRMHNLLLNVYCLYGVVMQITLQQTVINHCLSFVFPHLFSVDTISYDKRSVFTDCNSDCFCSASDWDPICGENNITYVSPCLAGCTSSSGSGKNTVSYHGTP